MRKVKSVMGFVLRTLLNPVTIISGGALIVHNNAMMKIRAEIGIPYGLSDEQINAISHLPSEIKDLGLMMNKPWWYAMNDYNMQILILIVALILALYQLISNSIPLLGYSFSKITESARNHNSSYLFYFISILFFGTGIVTISMSNSYASVDILRSYLPSERITGKNRLPPWNLITIARGLCIIYSAYLIYYFTYKFPGLINQLKQTRKKSEKDL